MFPVQPCPSLNPYNLLTDVNHDVENYPGLLKHILTITRILLQGRRPEQPQAYDSNGASKGPWGKQCTQHERNFLLKLLVLTLLKRTDFLYVMVQVSQARDSVLGRRERRWKVFSFPSECDAPNKLAQWGSNYTPNSLKTLKDLTQACVQYGPAAL